MFKCASGELRGEQVSTGGVKLGTLACAGTICQQNIFKTYKVNSNRLQECTRSFVKFFCRLHSDTVATSKLPALRGSVHICGTMFGWV